ncbi:tripartite tricarboxylate transporter TctB family protein [Natrialbaceae archaeon A-CW1-1]
MSRWIETVNRFFLVNGDFERFVENLTILGLIGFCLVFLYASLDLDFEAARVPLMLIGGAIFCFLAFWLKHLIPQEYSSIFTKSNSGISTAVNRPEEQDSHTGSDMIPSKMAVISIWYFVYLLSLYYVGFFTTNFVFIFLYILIHEHTLSGIKRLVVPTIAASFTVVFLYVLFADLMRIGSIWRLGVLP